MTLGDAIRSTVARAWFEARDAAIDKLLDEARPLVRREVAAVGNLADRAHWSPEKIDEVVEARAQNRCARAIAALRQSWDSDQAATIAAALQAIAWQTLNQLQVTPIGDGVFAVHADLRLTLATVPTSTR